MHIMDFYYRLTVQSGDCIVSFHDSFDYVALNLMRIRFNEEGFLTSLDKTYYIII